MKGALLKPVGLPVRQEPLRKVSVILTVLCTTVVLRLA